MLGVVSAERFIAHPRAQTAASIRGTVTDTSGAVLAQATVEASAAGRRVATSTTGADGIYHVPIPTDVPIELRVRRSGFAEQIAVLPGTAVSMARDITLQVGGVSDTLVVTASRGRESRATSTQSVTVMTRGDIEALGSASLGDVMRFVPGVNVESAGREGAVTSMFARGGESDYNLVLVDGVRVNLSGGPFDLSRISAAEIERVEVVRGAQSSLWGSDAMGSVVQIITRRASRTDAGQASGSLERGSFDTWRGGLHVNGGAQSQMDYQAGVTHRRSEGAFAARLPETDRFEQTAVDGELGATLGSRMSVRTGLRYSRALGRSVGQITYGSRDSGGAYNTKELSWHADATHALGARFTGTATFNDFRHHTETADTFADPPFTTYAVLAGTPSAIFPNGSRLVRLIDQAEFDALVAAAAAPGPGQFLASTQSFDFPFASTSRFRRPAFRYQGDYVWGSGQRLSAGYEWERETNPLTAGFSLDNNAAFVQQQFTLRDRWFATIGVRMDRKEAYDTFVSPKLSAGGFLLPFRTGRVSSLKVFGNLGKGIKSPTFLERFGGSFADPAPDLEVERARTADAGVEATFANQHVRALATYFNNDYVDQVAFRSGVVGDGIPEFINIDGSDAKGWELEVALQQPVAGFSAGASYAYIDHRVVTSSSTSQQFQPGQPLLRRPKHSGAVRAAYAHGPISVFFNLRIVGQRHDNSFLSLRSVPNAALPSAFTTDITVNPGYDVATLGVDVRAHDMVTVFVRSDNVGDTVYENALGYPGLPRAVMAGLRFNVGTPRSTGAQLSR
ncbi:MAG: TonB-dependent receptor domain-containing protein [Vicinamibacterales bacterium]